MLCAVCPLLRGLCFFFFFNDTATTEIYTLSLHDALPISSPATAASIRWRRWRNGRRSPWAGASTATAIRSGTCGRARRRSEEHTSELQSPCNLVCRLLLEKKKRPRVLTTIDLCNAASLPD